MDKNFMLAVPLLKGFNNSRLFYPFVKASLVLEVRKLGSSKPMTFATFQALEVFRLLIIF